MKVHAAIAQALADHGVDTIFGLVGDANVFIAHSFSTDVPRTSGAGYVNAAHEAAAVSMADGYARVSGRLGVATVTHGPGLTNTVTPLVEAVRNGTPMLLISGDTAVEDRHNLQNLPQEALVLATGAGFVPVRSPATAVEDVAIAIRRAHVERRPIVLDVPIDFAWVDVEERHLVHDIPTRQALAPDPVALDRAVGILASARRPVVLAGRGCDTPEARAALLRLAERIGAPVATTLMAKGLFRGEAFDLGVFGTFSTPVATETILGADCVVAFGAGLNPWTTAQGSLVDGKVVIHCDLDPTRLGAFRPVDAAIVGDAAVVADTVVRWLDEAEVEPTGFRSPQLAEALAAFDVEAEIMARPDTGTAETVDMNRFILRMDRVLPEERTLVYDVGRFVGSTMRYFSVPDPRAFVQTSNFASVGLGMGTAVGAGIGDPARTVVLVTGDGGFMMGGLAELNSAVRHGIDLIVLVFNDGSYGAEHIQLLARNLDPQLSLLGWPDFAPVADALGATGVTVRTMDDFELAVKAIEGRDRPLLVDIKLDPHDVPGVLH